MLNGERDPGTRWAHRDTVLAVALTEYEAGLCAGCGQPLAMTRADSEHRPHGYAVESFSCQACSELEIAGKREAGPGTKRYTVLDD